MTGNIVARRYAHALFALGQKAGGDALTAYGKDLVGLAELLEAAPEILRILRNPIFSIEEKKAVLAKIFEKLGPTEMVRNFCNLLADKNRLGYLPDINAVYGELLDVEQGVVRGELITAIELGKAKQDALKDQLAGQTGKKLVLAFGTDKSILGGVVLKVGDMIMDASLRAQLGMMQENIKRGD